jgi:hypothetical protein
MILAEAGVQMVGGLDLTTVQVETAAATIKDYLFPFGFEILDWGVVITEDFSTHSTDPVVAIQVLDKTGGTVTTVSSLTLGSSNTSLYKGDGHKEVQTVITADADLLTGHVVWGPRGSMPYKTFTNQILRLAVTTAANSSTGAITPFAFVKPLVDARASKSWMDISSS